MIIEQARKENLFYGKEKKELLLRKGYDLKLSTIENRLNIIMKRVII